MKTQEYNKIAIAFQWWCAHGAFVNPTHCDDLRSFRRDLDEALLRGAFSSEQLPKVLAFTDHINKQIATLDGTDDCTFICKRCGDRVSKRQKLGSLSPATLSPSNSPPNHHGATHPSLQPLLKLPPFLHSRAWGCQCDFEQLPDGTRVSVNSVNNAPRHSSQQQQSASTVSTRPAPLRLDIIAAGNPSTKPKRYHLQLRKQEFRINRLSERIKRRSANFALASGGSGVEGLLMQPTSVAAPATATTAPSNKFGAIVSGTGGGDHTDHTTNNSSDHLVSPLFASSHPISVPMPIPAPHHGGRLSTASVSAAPAPLSSLPPRHSSRRASKSDILQSPTARKVARPHRFTATAASVIAHHTDSMSDRDRDHEQQSLLQQQQQQQQQSSNTSHPLLSSSSHMFDIESDVTQIPLFNGSNDYSLSSMPVSSGVGFLSPTSQPFFIQLESPVPVAAAPSTSSASSSSTATDSDSDSSAAAASTAAVTSPSTAATSSSSVSSSSANYSPQDIAMQYEHERFINTDDLVHFKPLQQQQQQQQSQPHPQDTPIPTAIVAVPVPIPVPVLTAPKWHDQLYDSDHSDHEHDHAEDHTTDNTLLPALPMYGYQRSGYDMMDEPSSEFAALHIVENEFHSTPIPGQPQASGFSLPRRESMGLLAANNNTERCVNCENQNNTTQQHSHRRRRSSASSTGSAPAGYASLPMSASDALYLHKQQQQFYQQQQQQFQLHLSQPILSAASHLDRHPDIYAQPPPSYVSTGPRKEDSCVIS